MKRSMHKTGGTKWKAKSSLRWYKTAKEEFKAERYIDPLLGQEGAKVDLGCKTDLLLGVKTKQRPSHKRTTLPPPTLDLPKHHPDSLSSCNLSPLFPILVMMKPTQNCCILFSDFHLSLVLRL